MAGGTALLNRWDENGEAKIALRLEEQTDEAAVTRLLIMQAQAQSLGVVAELIHDGGITEVEEGTATVLGLGPAPKSVVDIITGRLSLL